MGLPSPTYRLTSTRTGWAWRIVLTVVVIVVITLAGRRIAALLPQFSGYIASLGATGPVVFVFGYALACVAFVPASLLTLAAGAIFGLAKGVVLVFAGAMLGASASFLIARYVARGAVERRVTADARFAALDRAIGAQGRRVVFLLRLSPVFPFSLLNYALGLTRVTFADYVIASVGILPGTVMYVYYGRLAGDVAALAAAPRKGPEYYATLIVGLVATIIVTMMMTRAARSALHDAANLPQS